MVMFGESTRELLKETDKCLDPQLWHACAGGMVQMPAVHSTVYYFPQGHAEHAQGIVDFENSTRIPPLILCRVTAVKFMADPESDEVFAKIQLVPTRSNEPTGYGDDDDGIGLGRNGPDGQEKPASFAKTLTQSDANNGGGFSVPRYCAETIFPRLDYSADPPVQTVLAKDVHGEVWKFRHIYRGTPRRHLLTTGWSTFVNQKKLVAGDSIVFLRAENGDLCVGIRRAKREFPSGWNFPIGNCASAYGGFSVLLREEENKLMRRNGNCGKVSAGGNMRGRGRVKTESVLEAARRAADGQPFEVVYYPRASTPEFCVKAVAVRAAMRTQWCPGMRFKMAFETEDSSRISWFMGMISSVQVADTIKWPNSPWRLLQVTWDEPDLLQNVKHVNPWLVELVSSMPSIHLSPFSPPRKKLRDSQHPEFPVHRQLPTPIFHGNPLRPNTNSFCYFPDSTPAGIQGARHAQFGISLPDLHLNKLQSSLSYAGFNHLDHHTAPASRTTGPNISNPRSIHDDISCLLTIGNQSTKISGTGKIPQLVLFGKTILTEEQMSLSDSRSELSPGATGNSSSDMNTEKTTHNTSDSSRSAFNRNGLIESLSSEEFPCNWNGRVSKIGSEAAPCKVFMESEDVGRTLDLSVFGSYEELYGQLADMFGIEKAELISHLLYRDATGAVKHTGDEPFSEFTKTARRLTILMDVGTDNLGM
ncbi:auxin response factor 18-like [Typha angustifolia]|uniref:auxin response factor 18-like n=1 Tax=Typha angustifolia TaxID=59011 RepID=UPI003C3071F2